MRFFKRSSFLVFGLLMGGLCAPGMRASAEETAPEDVALEIQAPDQHMTVAYLTEVSFDSADASLPDDPGAGVQQQTQVGSGAPPAAGSSDRARRIKTRLRKGGKPSAFFLSFQTFAP